MVHVMGFGKPLLKESSNFLLLLAGELLRLQTEMTMKKMVVKGLQGMGNYPVIWAF